MIDFSKIEKDKRAILAFRHPGITGYSMSVKVDFTDGDNVLVIPASFDQYVTAFELATAAMARASRRPRRENEFINVMQIPATPEDILSHAVLKSMLLSNHSGHHRDYEHLNTIFTMFDRMIVADKLDLDHRLLFQDDRLKTDKPFTDHIAELISNTVALTKQVEEKMATARVEHDPDWGTW